MHHTLKILTVFSLALSGLVGCADRLWPRGLEFELPEENGGTAPPNLPATSGNFAHSSRDEGIVVSTIVDATDAEEWQRLDLDSGYADTADWDLAFRRFAILSNGGITGGGGVQLAVLPGEAFETLERAPGPEGNWGVDAPDGDDEDTFADSAFSDWYEYDVADHSLTPKSQTFLVRSTADRFYKLRILDYYDDAGTSGVLTFEWAEIAPPEAEIPPSDVEPSPGGLDDEGDGDDDEAPPSPAELVVDARSYDDWIYVKVGRGVVSVTSPETSLEWDLAIRRVTFRTNGGSSGSGDAGAKVDDSGLSFDELESTSADGFVVDEVLEATGAPGSTAGSANPALEPWYDYHGLGSLTPKEQTFVLRAANGTSYAKLRILEYTSGKYRLALLPLDEAP